METAMNYLPKIQVFYYQPAVTISYIPVVTEATSFSLVLLDWSTQETFSRINLWEKILGK